MSSLGKLATRTRSLARSIHRRVEAARLERAASYDRADPPELNHEFRTRLWDDASPFSQLLATDAHTIANAERILKRRFRVFGREIDGNDPAFSWHKDFYSGAVYPRVAWLRIRCIPDEGKDIIVPWELSRLQFIPTLIQAHRLTGDVRCARFFREIVDEWAAANPPLIGVNWWTGMDIAIRAFNLALGTLYFHDAIADAVPYHARILWLHAESLFARDFAEVRSHRNNHFLIAAVGLLMLSLVFRGNRAAEWLSTATDHLEREILRQFNSDGGNFESAVHYHQLSLESVLFAACLARVTEGISSLPAAARRLSEEVEQRLAKAVEFASDYMYAFGRSPQFGDSSDGRLLYFRDYFQWDPLDHDFLSDLAVAALPGRQCPPKDQIINPIYPRSGYGFFRNDRYGICLAATPVAEAGHGGHNHCDKTSFVLQIKGRPVIVDSGTYGYTADLRQRFARKRTRAHNLVMLDGLEQAEVTQQHAFGRPEGIACTLVHESDSARSTWRMTHDGYCRFDGLGRVGRVLRCEPSRVEIEDSADGSGEHEIEILFHLHPGIAHRVEASLVYLACEGTELCRLEVPEGFEVRTEQGYWSHAYREREPATVIVFARRVGLPICAHYRIVMS